MRKTKIICTIGPSCESEQMITKLVKAGMNVARINFSHGTNIEHKTAIEIIREVSKKLSIPVAILADLAGPKIRTGEFKDGIISLKKNTHFTITTQKVEGNQNIVSTTYSGLCKDVKKGDILLLSDGLIKLQVMQVKGKDVICAVIEGGSLRSNAGINLPDIDIRASSFTAKDRKDLLFAMKMDIDYVATSFVRKASDVMSVKKAAKNIPVIAKIEKKEALDNLDLIIDAADGIMVARGDLGVEIQPEMVPMIQKTIIAKAKAKGKLVITATQMLESMVEHSRPTRAEASDVANAILDGTDAVMLSEETAAGKYPVEATQMMENISKNVEESKIYKDKFLHFDPFIEQNFSQLIANAASHISSQLNLKGIIVFTQTGGTGRYVSSYRPAVPIYAVTPDEKVWRQLSLIWGVMPIKTSIIQNTDELVQRVDKILINEKIAHDGDNVAIIFSSPIYKKRPANLLKLHNVGDSD